MRNQDKGADLEWLAAATAPPGSPIYDRWRAGLPNGTTPAELLTLAHTHRVVVPVAHTLTHSQSALPPELVSGFQRAARPRRMRMLRLARELVVLAELFSAEGVPLLCLKGPALSQELFGDSTLRDSLDLDLLVPLQYLPAADTILTNAGYQRLQLVDGKLIDFPSERLSARIEHFGHINYYDSKSNVSVELHWRLFHIEELVPDNREMIWQGVRQIIIGGKPVQVMAKASQLLYLTIHAIKHECERLQWVADLAWLLSCLDAATIAEAAESARRLGVQELFLAPLLCAANRGLVVLPPVLSALGVRASTRALTALCDSGLERSSLPPKSKFHRRIRLWRLYWQLATHREPPIRSRLMLRIFRIAIGRIGRAWCGSSSGPLDGPALSSNTRKRSRPP